VIGWLRHLPWARLVVVAFAAYGLVHAATHALALPIPPDVESLLRLALLVPATVGFMVLWDCYRPPDTPLDTRRGT
jgi:hypothetical protein